MKKSSLFLFCLLLLASCGPRFSSSRHPSPGQKNNEESNKPWIQLSVPETPGAERDASNALVEDGRRYFEVGRYDQASDLFQEALRVDPSNGIGYYFLAASKIRSGEYGEAEGLLEKASGLLGQEESWKIKIDQLRQDLRNLKK